MRDHIALLLAAILAVMVFVHFSIGPAVDRLTGALPGGTP